MSGVRHASWVAGGPARAALLLLIKVYRVTLSGWLGGQCRFYPSCSHYAEDAIRTRGAVHGAVLATWRVLRCNPFGKGGLDAVPARKDAPGVYEPITRTRKAAV